MTYFLIYYQVCLHLHHCVLFINVTIQIFNIIYFITITFFWCKCSWLWLQKQLSPLDDSSFFDFKSLTFQKFVITGFHFEALSFQNRSDPNKKNNLNCQPSCELTGLEIKKARYLYTFNMFRQQQSQRGPWYLDMSRPLLTKQFDIIWQEWRGKLFCEGEEEAFVL